MTKEQIFIEIQNVVSNNPVLVIGSGASVPYHIPGMDSLATALKFFFSSHPYTNSDSVKAVQEFVENMNMGMGLEEALLNTKATDEVENDIVRNVWNLVGQADKEVYTRLLLPALFSAPSEVVVSCHCTIRQIVPLTMTC